VHINYWVEIQTSFIFGRIFRSTIKKNGLVEQGSGWSVPLVLNLTKSDDVVSIAGHKSPGDGSLYSKDIKIIFPKELQKTILFFPSNSTQVKEVGQRLKKRVDEWSK